MILVTSHKSLLTASERRRVKLLSEKINLHFRKIISLEWDFEQEGRDCVAIIRVHSATGYYRAKAIADRYGESANLAAEKLMRQRDTVRKIAISKRKST